jgi:oligopeptide/dipeptide ABC transporter ATP-binding protein
LSVYGLTWPASFRTSSAVDSVSAWPLLGRCRRTPACISLLEKLQTQLGVSYLFIAHDLAAVAYISHQIAVMYLGKIVEIADSLELCAHPLHPYTRALFAASLPSHPDEVKEEIVLTGEVPSALNPPPGCHFHPRCPFAMPQCSETEPMLAEVSRGHKVACHLY